jgi:hypothetical protein
MVTDRDADRTIFWILLLASMAGVLLGVPFIFAILSDAEPLKVWVGAGSEFLFFLVPACAVGVWLGKKVDLGPRLLREFVLQTPGRLKRALTMLGPSAGIGAVLGLPMLLGAGPDYIGPGPLDLFLRSLSAALTEEIFFRLGLMTLFAWILRSIVTKSESREPSLSIANLLAALLFAAAHLPGHVSAETATAGLVMGILIFNCVGGMIMGWLYARYGLLSAILAHFVGDVVGYVIPFLI